MNVRTVALNCRSFYPNSQRKEIFHVVEYSFYYQSSASDKALLDKLMKKGLSLAAKVNPGAANDSTRQRTYSRIQNNCIAGIVAEFCWLYYLNDGVKNRRVAETPFDFAGNQIDLRILKNNQTIEVRSSFPRAKIPFVLCHEVHQFDVIGPYKNNYKPDEIQKDFYVRTLFRLDSPREFNIKIREDGFKVHLTGGATWAMMVDKTLALEKNFVPDDELSVGRIEAASAYRVVPFSQALDTRDIYKLIAAI
jgi:hypothetical protein